MNKKIVVNTSPLIAWGKMQAFDFIGKLPYEFLCPAQVQAEISAGAEKGYSVVLPSWIRVLSLNTPLTPFALANLDAGEAAVIELALEQNIPLVCLDEIKGRRAALASGLQVVGSLGLLGKSKIAGLISEARPFVEKAQMSGIYYDEKLVESFLGGLGE
jgi:predicted nucleic acid-binding protein